MSQDRRSREKKMPNAFAQIVLLAWPLVVIWLFKVLPYERAVVWSLLAAFLLLPERIGFDFPVIPPLTKTTIPSLTVFLICLPMLIRARALLPASKMARFLMFLYVISPIGTVIVNSEPLFISGSFRPGLSLYDSLSEIARNFLIIIPFILGRAFLHSEKAQRDFLVAFSIAILFYTIPILFEIRISPQLNIWIYGFFQSSFGQQVRFGGFRAVVFLRHGLEVAMVLAMATIATIMLWRHTKAATRAAWGMAAGYLMLVLVLSKSVAAILYVFGMAPVVRLLAARRQILISGLLAAVVFTYPILRANGIIPVDAMVAQAEALDPARAQSLAYRFENEDILLAHANEKPIFGWGSGGRNRVYDPVTGEDLSTTDGIWIIVFGTSGWVGYTATFGLLLWPIVLLWRRSRQGAQITQITAGLVAVHAMVVVNLIPNSFLPAITWLIAGALLGTAEPEYVPTLKKGRHQTLPFIRKGIEGDKFSR